MGDYKKNPKRPIQVAVPNKIRKRIAMHETESAFLKRLKYTALLKKIRALPAVPVAPKRGSLWSRFTGEVKNFLQNKLPGRKVKR